MADPEMTNAESTGGEPLLCVRDLSIGIRTGRKKGRHPGSGRGTLSGRMSGGVKEPEEARDTVPVVDSVSYEVGRGEILGIVGESGCGKTVSGLAVMGLLPEPLAVTGGSIFYKGRDLTEIPDSERRQLDGDEISMIYQEPLTSLNPLLTIGDQVMEPLFIHRRSLAPEEIRRRAVLALAEAGLPDPEASMRLYPHQLSGGMRQRVMTAMAVICRPSLMIADEPTTALDVTVQAQVLRLLKRISRRRGMSVIFISHDLAVIHQICDRVIVMYAGRIAESGPADEIIRHPVHEYTKGLIRSIPLPESRGQDLPAIPGRVPPAGEKRDPCPFAPRCAMAREVCRREAPPGVCAGSGHMVYCHAVSGRNPGGKMPTAQGKNSGGSEGDR